MRGLIIAAGRGKRLSNISDLKPLVQLDGKPLLEHIFLSVNTAGIDDFVVVTGYKAREIVTFIDRLKEQKNLKIDIIHNEEWDKENGLSVLKSKGHFEGKFCLLMADHIFDASILKGLMKFPLRDDEVVLAIDCKIKNNPMVNLEDATKVRREKDKILNIGKTLKDFNAIDTGVFLCTPAIFSALEQSIERGDSTLSGGIQILADSRKARVMDIGGRLWIDVDDENDLHKASQIVWHMAKTWDPEHKIQKLKFR